MKKTLIIAFSGVILLILAFKAIDLFSDPDEKYLSYKIDPTQAPIQKNYEKPEDIWIDDVRLEAVADYEISAVVLSKERYIFESMSFLAPIDLALGWGRMSDPEVYNKLEITQGGRWYKWRTKSSGFPIPRREIETSSANTHIIPSNEEIKRNIIKLKKNYKVKLKGKLVNVYLPNGAYIKTSRTRNDIGGGSCEILYVESFEFEWQ